VVKKLFFLFIFSALLVFCLSSCEDLTRYYIINSFDTTIIDTVTNDHDCRDGSCHKDS